MAQDITRYFWARKRNLAAELGFIVHVTSSLVDSQHMQALPVASAYTILRIKRKRNEEPLDALGKTLVNATHPYQMDES